ncbi:MAG: HAD family hydrolase [Clostridia bacterium]|nr:HAD family hydrolase [Clostridia bacterium]
MIKAVLFDLDGTLLPMDLDEFIKYYFSGIGKKVSPDDPERQKRLIGAVWDSTMAMIKNRGEKVNHDVFWDTFFSITGDEFKSDLHLLDEFYKNEYDSIRTICGLESRAAEVVSLVKELGLTAVLATNPIFPPLAVEKRIRWAGIDPSVFDYITTYENSHYAKPNPAYYTEIAATLSLSPEECLMVGNDVGDDMVAGKIGMHTFLLTPCLINKKGEDIAAYRHGGYDELIDVIRGLR